MIMEEHWKLVYVIGILALGFAVKSNADGSISCGFPAIYNFGDSNSDTAEGIKLPYLSAYMDSIGTNFRHGANFATGGSSVRPPGFSPFNLGIQISQFIQFKARTTTLYNQLSLNSKFYAFHLFAFFAQRDHNFETGNTDTSWMLYGNAVY
ncbi:hypothetical protein Golob_020484 [Gossypium lobatum]|uniref:GDSL esterase/lipase n=1 Tax=Gossypium lobatum TaxID=34289 RepID=A0A7J8LAI7_9ROSI|nr:hypothetical protein [Gossypium lobatum]